MHKKYSFKQQKKGVVKNMSLKEKNIKHETAIEKIIDVMGLTRVLVERMYGKYIYHAAFVSTGRKLRKLREGRGLSVESLAERIGCSPECIKLYEDGVIPPSGKVANSYSDFFNKTFSELFEDIKDVSVIVSE